MTLACAIVALPLAGGAGLGSSNESRVASDGVGSCDAVTRRLFGAEMEEGVTVNLDNKWLRS